MKTPTVRAALATAAITLALVATPSQAIAPVLALLGKQLLQDMVMTTAKSMLMNSLSGMGCKGTALANALDSFGSVKGGGLGALRSLPGAAGVGGMPPEMAAQMMGMMPGGGLDAEQSASIAGLQRLMGAPLSPLETIATINEMSELGLLSTAMKCRTEGMPVAAPAISASHGHGYGHDETDAVADSRGA